MNKQSKIKQTTKSAKLIAVGNSTGIVIPKDILAQFNLEKGDRLSISLVPDGIKFRPYDAKFEEQMDAMRDVMKQRRNALRELAK